MSDDKNFDAEYENTRQWLKAYINKLENEIKVHRRNRDLLIWAFICLGLSAFFAPVDVKVGDVCLSCWDK